MKAVVVGYGSIGSRHARILDQLGCQTGVVSARDTARDLQFNSIHEAVRQLRPEYVVIASETSRHLSDLVDLLSTGFSGTILMEKPLFVRIPIELPQFSNATYIGYNLRFHPILRRLRELLKNESVVSVHAYVGQYLPLWRPGRDYRNVYSASKEAGGGVLRDLSHELDTLNWLLGGWVKLAALGGHLSRLEIDSDDVVSILMETRLCPVVTLDMNYLDRVGRRSILVNTDCCTIEADFNGGRILVDGRPEAFETNRDDTYHQMHKMILASNTEDVCSFSEGVDVLHMIAAAEKAVAEGRWVRK